jgi:hypothetical protein
MGWKRKPRTCLRTYARLELLESRTLPSFSPGGTFATGSVPLSGVASDLNRDGRTDLAVVNRNSDSVSVLLGLGDATFSPKTDLAVGHVPYAVAAADLNGDGRPDLVSANGGDNTVSVLLGTDAGTFAPKVDSPSGPDPWAVVSADFNGDGKLDLATANYANGANSVSVLLGNGDGKFQAPADYPVGALPLSLAAADLNGDGRADLAVVDRNTDFVDVLLGKGDGTLLPRQDFPVGHHASWVAAADVNADGRPDLIVTALDNTVSVLLGNGDGTYLPRQVYAAGAGPRSVAAADLNGDGKTDLAVADGDGGSTGVLLGNGDGTFLPRQDVATGGQPFGVIPADLNANGSLDLAVVDRTGDSVRILINDCAPPGTGALAAHQDFSAGDGPAGLAAADFNRDGTVDLAVADAGGDGVSVLNGRGDGTFQPAQWFAAGVAPHAVVAADFDRDGRPDLAAADTGGNSVSLLLGNGDGSFSAAQAYATGAQPQALATADFNGDGKPDLVTANGGPGADSVSLLLGNGDGTFQPEAEIAAGATPAAVVAADIDRDGKTDLAVADLGGDAVCILRGNGDGTFEPAQFVAVGSAPRALAAGDFDADGKPDLAVAESGDNAVSLLRGAGDGTFLPPQTIAGGVAPSSLAAADVNQDGRLDLAATDGAQDQVVVLLGNGDGTFHAGQSFASGAGPLAVRTVDVNADGRPDVVTADSAAGAVSVLTGRPNAPTHFSVSGPGAVTAGDSAWITADALTPENLCACSYGGTVHFTSSDPKAQLPADYAFTLADGGAHTFPVTLQTAGPQTVTVVDNADATVLGSFSMEVSAAAPASLVVAGFPSPVTAGVTGKFSVTAQDAFGNTAADYAGTVHFTSSDPQAVLPGDYAFAPGDHGSHSFVGIFKTAATQTLNAADTVNGGPSGSQAGIAVQPAAAVSLAVAGFPSPVTAGTPGAFTVTANDAYGNTATGYTGTVHFTSSDPQADLPADYVYTPGDNGHHSFTATLKTAAVQSLSAADADTPTLSGTQSGVAVQPAPAASLAVAGFPTPATAGVPGGFTVTALDPYGNVATNYAGTVHFTSSDPHAVLPADTPLVGGSGAFTATLKTAGTQTLNAADTVNGGPSGSQPGIVVKPAAAASLTVAGFPALIIAGVTGTFTLTAWDAYGNVATAYGGTVHFSSSDSHAVLPPDGLLTGGTGKFSATLQTVGLQSLTAADVANGFLTGTQTGIMVLSGHAVSSTQKSIAKVGTGKSYSGTVTAGDAYGNVAAASSGTVHFMSPDPQATLPADSMFPKGDHGINDFGPGVEARPPFELPRVVRRSAQPGRVRGVHAQPGRVDAAEGVAGMVAGQVEHLAADLQRGQAK